MEFFKVYMYLFLMGAVHFDKESGRCKLVRNYNDPMKREIIQKLMLSRTVEK